MEVSAQLAKGNLLMSIRFDPPKDGKCPTSFTKYSGDISDFHSRFHQIQAAIKGAVTIQD
eukprot:NODE_20225_length_265_cov_2.662037_g19056_i0.p1 GENE.NODE_20225_length_265_cov_2.662037_g19056_i0~~NODE_20225_length_265_cov_2.662037_g19056_i0.p1  ORF type:complete len:67 (+),score=21.27 NODE_20225_length_265_cov_2.662037_g19056_i0:24-203(+)